MLLGFGLLVAGVALWSVAGALVVAGVLLMVAAVDLRRPERPVPVAPLVGDS